MENIFLENKITLIIQSNHAEKNDLLAMEIRIEI